jgi:hypothetical protein
VPEANWKVVLDEEQKVLLSVIIPNLTSTGTDPIDDQSQACDDSQHFDPSRNLKKGWHDYVVPLGEIEAEAKINLETFRQ